MDLQGKSILLTVALGSLGRAQAMALGRAGGRLFLPDRPDAAAGAGFAASLAGETGTKARFIGLDLNDIKAAPARIEALILAEGPTDILVNNAALIINTPQTRGLCLMICRRRHIVPRYPVGTSVSPPALKCAGGKPACQIRLRQSLAQRDRGHR